MAYVKPIPVESLPVFARPRLPWRMRFPVREMFQLIELCQVRSSHEGVLKEAVGRLAEGTKLLFSRDIADLLWLHYGLSRPCILSSYGVRILEQRLDAIYSDGVEFRLTSDQLKRLNLPPVEEQRQKIEEAETVSTKAMQLSKTIGENVGIEIRYVNRFPEEAEDGTYLDRQ
ncbi:MAG: hypothetical protein QW057_09905 [Candidatus Bathyarchaeia archaeon]